MLTKQETFDRALWGVRAQGGERAMRGSACVYYDEVTERRCGIGQALTRAQAMDLQDELEVQGRVIHGGVGHSFVYACVVAAGLPDDVVFLRDLQSAHDGAGSPNHFEERMKTLARDYRLEYQGPA